MQIGISCFSWLNDKGIQEIALDCEDRIDRNDTCSESNDILVSGVYFDQNLIILIGLRNQSQIF